MIAAVTGNLLRREPDAVVELTGGGVALEVKVSGRTLESLPGVGEPVKLWTHLSVREDGWTLFGFLAEEEREMFRLLLSVSGIGPRLALVILSGMPSDDLIGAIRAGDARRLQSISGVGKAIATRMANELREKLDDLAMPGSGAAAPRLASGDDDLVEALVNLGYKRTQADAAIRRLDPEAANAPEADRLRAALRLLSKG